MEALFATFGINGKLLLIQAVNFGVTAAVLWYFLFRPLFRVIAARRDTVAQGVADAEAAAKTKAEIEGSRASILSKAEKEAESVVERAVKEGKGERAAIVKGAQQNSEAIVADARAQAEELRRKAVADAEKDIARMAVLTAEKILKES